MKRDGKGQQVKSFQAWVMQPDLSKTKIIAKVFFQVTNGLFSIYLQKHLVEAMSHIGKFGGATLDHHADRLSADRLDDVVEGHAFLLSKYEQFLREQKKRKVIAFKLEVNTMWTEDRPDAIDRNDISFCERPALALAFDVLFQIGDTNRLYRRAHEDGPLSYVGNSGKNDIGTVIDWTEEREAFFTQMRAGLLKAIDRLLDFEISLGKNPQKAIESLMGGGPQLLPAPGSKRVGLG